MTLNRSTIAPPWQGLHRWGLHELVDPTSHGFVPIKRLWRRIYRFTNAQELAFLHLKHENRRERSLVTARKIRGYWGYPSDARADHSGFSAAGFRLLLDRQVDTGD